MDRRIEIRFAETNNRFASELARGLSDLQHTMTLRLGGMIAAGFGVFSLVSALV